MATLLERVNLWIFSTVIFKKFIFILLVLSCVEFGGANSNVFNHSATSFVQQTCCQNDAHFAKMCDRRLAYMAVWVSIMLVLVKCFDNKTGVATLLLFHSYFWNSLWWLTHKKNYRPFYEKMPPPQKTPPKNYPDCTDSPTPFTFLK